MGWRALVAGFALLLAACGGGSGGGVTELKQAELAGTGTDASVVVLPHAPGQRGGERVTDQGEWVYRLRLPAFETDAGSMAVSIPGRHADVRLAFNGQPLMVTRVTPYQSTGVYALLPQLIRGAPGDLEVRLRSRVGLQSRLDPVQLGDAEVLHRLAQRQSLQLSFATAIAFGILFVTACISLALAIIQSQPPLFVLSFVLFTIAMRQAMLLVFGAWSDDGAEFAFFVGSRYLTAIGMAMALPMLARQRYADLLLVAAVVGAVGVALLVGGWGSVALRRGTIIGFTGLVYFLALWRSWGVLFRSRQWFWLGVSSLMLVNYLTLLAHWVLSPDQLSADAVDGSTLFSVLLVLAMVGYIAMRMHRAYRESRARNLDLDQEVQRYKVELAQASAREQAAAIREASRRDREHWMREIHDGVGSQLVAARILSEKTTTQQSQAIAQTLEEALEQLRLLMGALSPDSRNLATLLGQMRYRLAPRLAQMGCTLSWSSIEIPDTAPLSGEMAMNVQRIAQESIANVLKHARATGIRIDIHERAGCYVVRIDDNGIGFDIDKAVLGRGIANMRARAAQCGARITWATLSPGTRVELILPAVAAALT